MRIFLYTVVYKTAKSAPFNNNNNNTGCCKKWTPKVFSPFSQQPFGILTLSVWATTAPAASYVYSNSLQMLEFMSANFTYS